MKDENGSRPENDSGAPEDHLERRREKNIDDQIISAPEAFAKRLLDQWGTIWLFEVSEGRRIRYVVEQGNQRWQFGVRFSARSKFEREAARQVMPSERRR
jgi:hypothetical protein